MFPEVLTIKPFRRLWLGQAISQVGDAFYYVIFMFMVQKVTGSEKMVGAVAALEAIPYLLFSGYSGVLADRMDRRTIMLLSDCLSGVFLLGLATVIVVLGKPPVALLLITPFCLSTVRCFFMPAKSAAIPALVPKESLLKANALSAATQSFMPLISLAISASVLSILYDTSRQWFFLSAVLLNAFSFLASAMFIFELPRIRPDRTNIHETHPLQDFKDGLRYMRERHVLVVLVALITIFRLMVAPFFVVYLATNKKWFGDKPATLAWFEFMFFLGMVLASSVIGRFKIRRPGLWFANGLLVVGVSVGAMAYSPSIILFNLLNLLAGLAIPCADVPINTYLQSSVPDEFRGRVNSVFAMVGSGVVPIGAGLGGMLVGAAGIEPAYLVMGGGMVLATLVGFLDRQFREMELTTRKVEPVSEVGESGVGGEAAALTPNV